MKPMRLMYRSLLLLVVILLAGCAQPAVKEFDQGKALLSQGKIEPGLEQIDLAAKDDPNNPEYRSYLFKQREAAVTQIIADAEAASNNGKLDEAESDYKRVLALDASNPRAIGGINGVQADRRRMKQVADAEVLFKKGDTEGAQALLRSILAENPSLPAAKALQQRIDNAEAEVKAAPSTLKLALKKPITLEFQDAPIKAVFQVISKVAGLNFVFDKDVRADLKATISVKNMSIEDAVRLLLVTNQLGQEVLNENTVLIYPNTANKNRDYQQLVVKSFYLANADVKKTFEMIKTILKTKDIFIDEKSNLLVMRDTPDVVRLAEKLIADQDLQEPEVVLEVEIMEVGKDFASNLGMQFANQLAAGVGPPGSTGSFTLEQWKNRDSSFYTFQITDPAVVLNLQKNDSDATLLANPRIRVKDREKAKIQIGQRLPVLTTVATAGVGSSESVNYVDVGLKLNVEPSIRLDNQVDMNVDLEVSNVIKTITTATGSQYYEIGTRNATTALRLKDGETQILAGLRQNNETSSVDKLPGFADIPLLGRLFSNDNHSKQKTELVLLITPHIVRNVTRPDAIYSEFPSGTESDIGGSARVISSPIASVEVEPALPSNRQSSERDIRQPAASTPDSRQDSAAGVGTSP